jgi:hypothetical protein
MQVSYLGFSDAQARQRFLSANMSMLKLTRVTRVPTLGEFTASIAHEVKQPPASPTPRLAYASCLTSCTIDLATPIEPCPQRD